MIVKQRSHEVWKLSPFEIIKSGSFIEASKIVIEAKVTIITQLAFRCNRIRHSNESNSQ